MIYQGMHDLITNTMNSDLTYLEKKEVLKRIKTMADETFELTLSVAKESTEYAKLEQMLDAVDDKEMQKKYNGYLDALDSKTSELSQKLDTLAADFEIMMGIAERVGVERGIDEINIDTPVDTLLTAKQLFDEMASNGLAMYISKTNDISIEAAMQVIEEKNTEREVDLAMRNYTPQKEEALEERKFEKDYGKAVEQVEKYENRVDREL